MAATSDFRTVKTRFIHYTHLWTYALSCLSPSFASPVSRMYTSSFHSRLTYNAALLVRNFNEMLFRLLSEFLVIL